MRRPQNLTANTCAGKSTTRKYSRRAVVIGVAAASLPAAGQSVKADALVSHVRAWIAERDDQDARLRQWQELEQQLAVQTRPLNMTLTQASRSGLPQARAMRDLSRKIAKAERKLERGISRIAGMPATTEAGALAKVEMGLRIWASSDDDPPYRTLLRDGVDYFRARRPSDAQCAGLNRRSTCRVSVETTKHCGRVHGKSTQRVDASRRALLQCAVLQHEFGCSSEPVCCFVRRQTEAPANPTIESAQRSASKREMDASEDQPPGTDHWRTNESRSCWSSTVAPGANSQFRNQGGDRWCITQHQVCFGNCLRHSCKALATACMANLCSRTSLVLTRKVPA